MNIKQLLLGGFALSLVALQSACSTATSGAWSQIQNEGLIPYLVENQANQDVDLAPVEVQVSGDALGDGMHRPAAGWNLSGVVTAQEVEGKPGFVFSPHTAQLLQVDVRDYGPGMRVRCPYTKKAFVVPGEPESLVVEPHLQPMVRVQPQLQVRERPKPIEASPSPAPSPLVAPKKPEPTVKKIATNDRLEPQPKMTGIPKNGGAAPSASDLLALPKKEVVSIPEGKRVPGKPNYVYSPFAASNQVVDVEGHAPGTKVKCPYTGKVFMVPGASEIPVGSGE